MEVIINVVEVIAKTEIKVEAKVEPINEVEVVAGIDLTIDFAFGVPDVVLVGVPDVVLVVIVTEMEKNGNGKRIEIVFMRFKTRNQRNTKKNKQKTGKIKKILEI